LQVEIFIDDEKEARYNFASPEKINIDTTKMSDGEHTFTIKIIEDDAVVSQKILRTTIQNGPAIAVHGIRDGDIISGEMPLIVNAYSSKVGDEFEPERIETHTPIPTWAWVLCLVIFAWAAGYLSSVITAHNSDLFYTETTIVEEATDATVDVSSGADWAVLGEQVYGNNCSSCHQATGTGLAGVFPALKANAVVLSDDPSEHILTIINGQANKEIDGVAYLAPMPPFGSILSDDEIAAVVNHERSHWGNNARSVTADDVSALK
jgi:mono/diheme cytochrome c family protein